jgi:putative heme-binding domain-containing protein
VLETTSHGTVTGLLVENTPQRVTVKVDATQEVRLKPEAITSRKPIPISTMPDGLISAMTPQQIVDLIGFLTTLKATGAAGSSR